MTITPGTNHCNVSAVDPTPSAPVRSGPKSARLRTRLGAIAALWMGSYLVWAIIPKSLGFFYYYYLPSIWLPIAIAAALHRFGKDRFRGWDAAILLVAAGLFVWFYPILSSAALSGPQAFRRWMWFDSWM